MSSVVVVFLSLVGVFSTLYSFRSIVEYLIQEWKGLPQPKTTEQLEFAKQKAILEYQIDYLKEQLEITRIEKTRKESELSALWEMVIRKLGD